MFLQVWWQICPKVERAICLKIATVESMSSNDQHSKKKLLHINIIPVFVCLVTGLSMAQRSIFRKKSIGSIHKWIHRMIPTLVDVYFWDDGTVQRSKRSIGSIGTFRWIHPTIDTDLLHCSKCTRKIDSNSKCFCCFPTTAVQSLTGWPF